jgi:hypothetical protein
VVVPLFLNLESADCADFPDALNGKLPELATQHFGHIRLADAKQSCDLHLLQSVSYRMANDNLA